MITDSSVQRVTISPGYEISRVIRGGWQMADGHGRLRGPDPVQEMLAFADAGITTFDCADIYTGVEELIGQFRLRYGSLHGADALRRIKVHTKFVPDLDLLPVINKEYVESIIDRSLQRLHLERLDLVQFHWWDYSVERWLDAAHWLDALRRAGKIDRIGLTNFDTVHVNDMLTNGIPITSVQLQYSLLDRRPDKQMVTLASAHDIALFCYGTVAGGFLGDAWLDKGEPIGELENRSLVKYKLIIDDFGGWELFQQLLRVLCTIADRHGVDIATVASAAVLGRKAVAAVIVGARSVDHLAANVAIGTLDLTAQDLAAIDAVLAQARQLDGDVYTLERDRSSKHGAIMKYNLNKGAA